MGGDPWGGDKPGVLDEVLDAQASAGAISFVLEGATRAGMTFFELR